MRGSLIGLDESPQLLSRQPAAGFTPASSSRNNNGGGGGGGHSSIQAGKENAAAPAPAQQRRGVADSQTSLPLFTDSPLIRGRRDAKAQRAPPAGLPPRPPPGADRAPAEATPAACKQAAGGGWQSLLSDSGESCGTFGGAAGPQGEWSPAGAAAAAPPAESVLRERPAPPQQQQQQQQRPQQAAPKPPVRSSWFGDPGKWAAPGDGGAAASAEFAQALGTPPRLGTDATAAAAAAQAHNGKAAAHAFPIEELDLSCDSCLSAAFAFNGARQSGAAGGAAVQTPGGGARGAEVGASAASPGWPWGEGEEGRCGDAEPAEAARADDAEEAAAAAAEEEVAAGGEVYDAAAQQQVCDDLLMILSIDGSVDLQRAAATAAAEAAATAAPSPAPATPAVATMAAAAAAAAAAQLPFGSPEPLMGSPVVSLCGEASPQLHGSYSFGAGSPAGDPLPIGSPVEPLHDEADDVEAEVGTADEEPQQEHSQQQQQQGVAHRMMATSATAAGSSAGGGFGSPTVTIQQRHPRMHATPAAAAATAAAATPAGSEYVPSPAFSDASFAAAAAAAGRTPYIYGAHHGPSPPPATPTTAAWRRGAAAGSPGSCLAPLPPRAFNFQPSPGAAAGPSPVANAKGAAAGTPLGTGWGLSGSVELAVNPVAVQHLVEQVASYEVRMGQLETMLQQVIKRGRRGSWLCGGVRRRGVAQPAASGSTQLLTQSIQHIKPLHRPSPARRAAPPPTPPPPPPRPPPPRRPRWSKSCGCCGSSSPFRSARAAAPWTPWPP